MNQLSAIGNTTGSYLSIKGADLVSSASSLAARKLDAAADPDRNDYMAVLVAVIVLLGVFVIIGALYLYICTRAGYSRVSVKTQILKKWGIPYGIKGYIYCS